MLAPSDYSAISDPVRKVLSDLNDQILADAARRIRKAGEMTNSAEWQLVRLQELGMSAKAVKAAVAKAAGLTRKEIDAIYTEAAKRSSRFDNEIMQKMGLPPVDPQKSPAVQQFIRAAKKQTNGELENITRSMGFVTKDGRFKPLQTAYQNAMDFTQFQVASGAMTTDQAVKMAVKDLADSGLRMVDYASGVRSFIEVAARRAVVTGVGQVVGKISEANADALGTNYVEVTAHAGARPEHAAWQGKVYCRVGSEPGYPNLVEATGYGTVGGLKGANCRHDFFPFIPGVSQRAYTDEQLKSIDPAPIQHNGRQYTYYEATQHQRQIESAMRQSKRRCVAYDAAGLKDDYTAEAARLQSLRASYADFSKQAGLVTQNQRAQVAGFGRGQATRATACAKQYYQNWSKSIGANDSIESLAKYYDVKYTDSPRYELLQGYARAVEKGDISPLVGFAEYEQTSDAIASGLVGVTTSTGVTVESFATHFIDRVIGQTSTSHPGMRQGVPINDVLDALQSPVRLGDVRTLDDGDIRQTLYGEKAVVTLSIRDKRLIQTNPP